MRILLVEDDDLTAEALAAGLRAEAYAVDLAATGEAADELMAVNRYDLVLLDWAIPAPTGIELLRQWRGAGHTVPILMLTGRGGLEDRVDGLDTGADDYLTKPFAFDELLARTRSLLRRGEKPLRPTLRAGDLEVDRAGRRVLLAGSPIELSRKEFAVLEYLLLHQGEVVTREELIDHAWDEAYDAMSNTVDVIVYRVRKKIDGGRDRTLLTTTKGVGYTLKPERS